MKYWNRVKTRNVYLLKEWTLWNIEIDVYLSIERILWNIEMEWIKKFKGKKYISIERVDIMEYWNKLNM